jgi:hypothetical protein
VIVVEDAGVWFVVSGAALGLVSAFWVRTRLASPAVAALLAASGAAIGWGGMALQPDPPVPQVVFAVLMLAVLVPVHVRVVFGPFGPRGRDGPEARRRG